MIEHDMIIVWSSHEHIYSHYEELEELTEMTDESLMLDIGRDEWKPVELE